MTQPLAALHRDAFDPHQLDAVEFVKRTPRCALWIPMSGGKTISAATAFCDLRNDFQAYRLLVIGPLTVAREVWKAELETWTHAKHLRFTFLEGGEKQIRKKLETQLDDFDVWAIGCDKVHVLARIFLGKPHPWDFVIIDESDKFKTAGSRRTQAVRLLTIHPVHVVLLAGTPMPNGEKDLWAQIYLLDRGERLGRTMTAFTERYFETYFDRDGRPKQRLLPGAAKNIHKALEDITFVLRPSDLKTVKEGTYKHVRLDLTPALKAQYDKFEQDYVLQMPSDDKITAVNAAALAIKLLQFASGAVYDEHHQWKPVHDLKIRALQRLVDEHAGEPILAVYNFQHEAARVQAAFPQAVVFDGSANQMAAWNRGEIPMYLLHPASGGHGLNLQFGGRILVHLSFMRNLGWYLQINARLARKGQKGEVLIYHLVMRDTVDELAIAALASKDRAQNSFQEGMKQHILELRKRLKGAV